MKKGSLDYARDDRQYVFVKYVHSTFLMTVD